MTIEEQFDAAIIEAKFNEFEIAGFYSDYRLAVKIGMALGYRIALADFQARIDGLNKATSQSC